MSRKQFTILFVSMLILAGCSAGEITGRPETDEPATAGVAVPTGTPLPGATFLASTSTASGMQNPPRAAISIAAGGSHTCAVDIQGSVFCWGANDHGQLGNGSMQDSSVPVEVEPMPGGAVSVAAGWAHTCALTGQGGVKCWGYNRNGELGNGKTADSDTPVDVAGLASGVAAVAAGDDHTCAVMETGGVKCWGFNKFGQLGDGWVDDSSIPLDVSGLTVPIHSVALGWGHTCALTDHGGVFCWGNNESGQLGDGAAAKFRTTRGEVPSLTGIRALAAYGGHACALTSWGTMKCWGNNDFGQLGDGTVANRDGPTDVQEIPGKVVAIAVGWRHTCAQTEDLAVYCWGWNAAGQLGSTGKPYQTVPTHVVGLAGEVSQLAGGGRHTCALGRTGWIQCWGEDLFGQLGDGQIQESDRPVYVLGFAP